MKWEPLALDCPPLQQHFVTLRLYECHEISRNYTLVESTMTNDLWERAVFPFPGRSSQQEPEI